MKAISIVYYRVFKNGTSVTEISFNDFIPVMPGHSKNRLPGGILPQGPLQIYSLPADHAMYYGYSNRAHAMEMAKSGALKYINTLIDNAEEGIAKLKQYRSDHYEDLNGSLLDSNIRRLENMINIK